jgi:hypothetical protein
VIKETAISPRISIHPRPESLQGFLPQLDEFYFPTVETKIGKL